MKMDFFTLSQQAQDFVLRLFVGSSEGTSTLPSSGRSYYTCAHCGTFARLRH